MIFFSLWFALIKSFCFLPEISRGGGNSLERQLKLFHTIKKKDCIKTSISKSLVHQPLPCDCGKELHFSQILGSIYNFGSC